MSALSSFPTVAEVLSGMNNPNPQLTETSFPDKVAKVLSEIDSMLIEKNKSYGDSALNPIRVFSRADSSEQIKVRIDDKLSRLARGSSFPGDNDIDDLIGYLVLLKISNDSKRIPEV